MLPLSIPTSSRSKIFLAYGIAAVLLVSAVFLGIAVGSVPIPPAAIARLFLFSGEGVDATSASIILDIRMPRVFLAALVGASLSLSGAGFQGLLKNPLADPYILGVSSGAAVGAVFVLFFGITIPWLGTLTLPLVSIITGFITLLGVLAFVRLVSRSYAVETIILTGVIFSAFFSALISLMIALTNEQLREIISWLLGSVSMRGWEYHVMILPFFFIGLLLFIWNAAELNVLTFGEERAKHLGVSVEKRKLAILAAASILTGAAVSVSGMIGFVGLVIPHLVRLSFGPDHRHLLPLSALYGASFLMLTDLVSRTIIAPLQLPIGIITALIGAPVFAFLLYRQRGGGRRGFIGS